MEKLSIPTRISKYLVHFGLSLLFPVILVSVFIFVTGDREFGMVYGLLFALLVLNIVFSFYFLKTQISIKIISGIIVTLISVGMAYYIILLGLRPSFDFYGFWTGLFTYGVSSVITWESIYRLLVWRNKNGIALTEG